MLLGDKWKPVAGLVQWLIPAGLAVALGSATEWILMPLGMMRRLVAVRLVRLCAVAVGIGIGLEWGVEGVAIGYSVSMMSSLAIELVWVMTVIRAHIVECVWGMLRAAVAAAVAGTAVFLVNGSDAWQHVLEILLYGAVFCLLCGAPGRPIDSEGVSRGHCEQLSRTRLSTGAPNRHLSDHDPKSGRRW